VGVLSAPCARGLDGAEDASERSAAVTRRSAVLSAVVSALCFGSLAVLASAAYDRGAEPLQLLVWRFGLATMLLALFLAVRSPSSLKATRGDLARYAVLSGAGYGAASLCFFFALQYADASVVAILLYTYPAMVVLVERFLTGVPLTRSRMAAVAVTFLGCVLVVDPFSAAGGVAALGIVLGLGAAAGYASFSVLSHRWLKGRTRGGLMVYMFAFTALIALAAALLTGSSVRVDAWTTEIWVLLAAIVLLPTFLAILLYFAALRSLGAAQAALISTTEPVFTIALAAMVLGERLSPIQWAGAALVIAGVAIAEMGARRQEVPAVV
jgi:drug/metabolite transporter (DMT)-like permease